MRHLIIATVLATAAGFLQAPAWAENTALVLANERYEVLGRLSRGAEPAEAARALEDMGFDLTVLPNGRAATLSETLSEFAKVVPGAERLVIVLSGRFATDGTRTWFLAADADEPEFLGLGGGALSVESVMHLMQRQAGSALLVLGVDPDEDRVFDAYLREGVGALDVPQGVTVVRGLPRDVAGFIQTDLVRPNADLTRLIAADRRLKAEGFLPRQLWFMGPAPGAMEVVQTPLPEDSTAAEDALWAGAVALDTAEVYRNYLSRYPTGRYAPEAEEALATLLSEPFRDDRLMEEAMDLSRDARRNIQRNLSLLDYNTRGIDGIFGPGTRGAITNWQQQNGFAQTGYLSTEQINLLDAQSARRAAELEAEAERMAAEQDRLDRAFWAETGARTDEPGLRAYLDRYPDGLFAELATEQLAAIEAEKRRQARDEERSAWDAALAADTVQDYRVYLQTFPDAAFRAEAEARITALEQTSGNNAAEQAALAAEAELGLNPITARLIEAKLDQLGLNSGVVDGVFDDATRRALRRYQRDRGLAVTGYVDEGTVVRLLADSIGVLR